MSGESDSDFVKSVEELLEAGNTSDAKAVFCDEEHLDNVRNNCWDLITVVSKFLSSQNNGSNFDNMFSCSKNLLYRIADICTPEEALLQFIEEIEEADSDLKFVTLLEPLRRVLTRIPKKVSISLAWGFNAINCYLNKYDIPDSENLQGKEKLLLDSAEDTRNINELYTSVLHFYDSLLQEISFKDEGNERWTVVLKFLIRLLGTPLVYLDVEVFDNIKGTARLSSEYLVTKVFQICPDPISLLSFRSLAENDDIFNLNDLGLASLYYLIFSEGIFIEKVPKVYDSKYFFLNSLHLVMILLNKNHQVVVEKGLKLACSLLQHIHCFKLSYFVLDSPDHPEFCKTLANVIIYNEMESFRKLALEVYQTYLSLFEVRGFYLILYNFISQITHSGLKGFTITRYKDLVVKEFENTNNVFIRGSKLLALLKKFCFLHKQEESDLIEVSDEIIATLNLLRFLTIRDKLNSTQIWDFIPVLDEIYFKPLRKGLELSRGHFKLKIKEIEEENVGKRTENDINVLIKGESLSKLSKNEKIEVLNYSLTVFDVIDSLLSRLTECIELREK